MSYVYGKIKNIKIVIKNEIKKIGESKKQEAASKTSIYFKVESDWKIIDYKEKNNEILNLYYDDEHDSYNSYDERTDTFQINCDKNEKIFNFLINNIHGHYKIEFNEINEVTSLELINE